ncbi:hypothetical protein [Nitrosomonas sp. Is37]|uniref:hypothetical protein n=1 Tax=Nitrosomonas sp. Is37 TaxID=3080535 RepID=UPI00294ACD96|nr:hypothetical protein [Nitrosomonas sp. Is37]MDV6345640.1 hypothetical protein [Nitrosomonas sp. Is37]
MGIDSLLANKRDKFVTSVTSCNVRDVTRETAPILAVTPVTPVTSQITNSQIEIIKSWLFKIGEPEEDHYLVIDKCRNDPEALAYFLRHAKGEFESSHTVADDERRPDDRIKCRDCLFLFGEHCQQWKLTNPGNPRYRPVQDILKRCSVFKPR